MKPFKVDPNAHEKVISYIDALPDWSKSICKQLRQIVLSVSSQIQEDWKWGHPSYYCHGMLCGIWAFKDHVTLVFFQGALIDDTHAVLCSYNDNLHNRHMKFSDASQIDEKIIREYLLQSIDNNTKGLRINQSKTKNIEIPFYIKDALVNTGLFESFNNLSYTYKKEYILWIKEAKKEETRIRRVEKMIRLLRDKFGMSSL